MPLTALHEAGVLDSSRDDLGAGLSWDQVHRVKPRPHLVCRERGHPMHAKVSSTGLRFFAHDAGADCPSAGESFEHQVLKLLCADIARRCGWTAELEHPGPDWRADMLATSPTGERIAFEVQLSQITPDEISRRTGRYERDGIRVVWITTSTTAKWRQSVAALTVAKQHQNGVPQWAVTSGCSRYEREPKSPGWRGGPVWAEHRVALDRALADMMHGQLVRDGARWVTPADLRRYYADERKAEAEAQARQARQGTARYTKEQTSLMMPAELQCRAEKPDFVLWPCEPRGEFGVLLLRVHRKFRPRNHPGWPYALIAPRVIHPDHAHLPVFVATRDEATALWRKYPNAQVVIPDDSPPPWPRWRLVDGRAVLVRQG